MKIKDVGYVCIISMFIAVGILSWRVYLKSYRQSDTITIQHFPKIINGWSSEELPISDDERAILETDNVFVRRYTNDFNEEVFLFVVYSQNNRKVSHPPEICYAGGGATILDSVKDRIESDSDDLTVDVNRLKVEKGRTMQIFTYWFKVGDFFTSNYWKQQAMIAYNSLLGKPSSSALIRISSTVLNGNEQDARQRIKGFGGQIIPLLQQYLP